MRGSTQLSSGSSQLSSARALLCVSTLSIKSVTDISRVHQYIYILALSALLSILFAKMLALHQNHLSSSTSLDPRSSDPLLNDKKVVFFLQIEY